LDYVSSIRVRLSHGAQSIFALVLEVVKWVSSDDCGDGECLLEKLMEVDCWVPCGGKGHWAVVGDNG